MILALTVSLFPSCGVDDSLNKTGKDEGSRQLELLHKSDKEGTFFKAIVQEANQAISISNSGIVYSTLKPNKVIVFPYNEPLIEGESRVYRSSTDNEQIEIAIYEDETARGFLEGKYDHSVGVRLVRKAGTTDEVINDFVCFGHYLYDSYLSGNWIFQSYEDKAVENLGINQIPMICVDVNTRSFSGSGGNHMIYGDIRCEGEFINFKIILSPEYVTNMFTKEKELLSVLESCNRFKVVDDRLYLFEDQVLKLTFIRDLYSI